METETASTHFEAGKASATDADGFECPYCDTRHADISGYTLHVIHLHGDGRVI